MTEVIAVSNSSSVMDDFNERKYSLQKAIEGIQKHHDELDTFEISNELKKTHQDKAKKRISDLTNALEEHQKNIPLIHN